MYIRICIKTFADPQGYFPLSLVKVADPDPHYFGKLDLDLDPHYNEQLDRDPHESQNSRASDAQTGAVDVHNGGVEAQNGAL
jgi:hypothetical protein